MSNNFFYVLCILFFLTIVVGCDNASTPNNQDSKKTPQQSVAKDKFACPMKCEGDKVYQQEGSCPLCKMALKKNGSEKHKDHGHDHKNHNHKEHNHDAHKDHNH